MVSACFDSKRQYEESEVFDNVKYFAFCYKPIDDFCAFLFQFEFCSDVEGARLRRSVDVTCIAVCSLVKVVLKAVQDVVYSAL